MANQIEGMELTRKQAEELVAEGRRAADSIWAHFRTRDGKRGEMAKMVASRNPGVKPSLWAAIVDGWMSEYRGPNPPSRYLAYMGFELTA